MDYKYVEQLGRIQKILKRMEEIQESPPPVGNPVEKSITNYAMTRVVDGTQYVQVTHVNRVIQAMSDEARKRDKNTMSELERYRSIKADLFAAKVLP